ncbi:MAG: LPS export ABC transporter periplasmic protein LptC [Verrucomicrobia bacterium]|nr:LPS export ABC transporter periplasmic protein LptC [Verrucomicrobiota bacterium]
MKSYAKTCAILGVTGSLAVTSFAQDATPGRKLDIPVPVGHEVKGLHLPIRNNDGKLDLLFDVETATRLDAQNVQMQTASIQTYNQQTSQPEVKIDLRHSIMNLDNNVIRSNEPVVITRSDFRLTGDGLEFNSKTRQGRVTGNIRMLIYNRNELDRKQEKSEPATQAP